MNTYLQIRKIFIVKHHIFYLPEILGHRPQSVSPKVTQRCTVYCPALPESFLATCMYSIPSYQKVYFHTSLEIRKRRGLQTRVKQIIQQPWAR